MSDKQEMREAAPLKYTTLTVFEQAMAVPTGTTPSDCFARFDTISFVCFCTTLEDSMFVD